MARKKAEVANVPEPSAAPEGAYWVTRLHARNFMLLRDLQIDMEGDIHEIKGEVNQGKSTVLTCIKAALNGIAPEMIRQGETGAEIELDLHSLKIRRALQMEQQQGLHSVSGDEAPTYTETLMVTDSEGARVKEGKKYLQAIVSGEMFDPITWVQLSGGERKGMTDRLRQQRNQLLNALRVSLTGAEIQKAVRMLGDDAIACMRDLGQYLKEVDDTQHAFEVCESIERIVYEARKRENTRVEDAENHLKLVPPPSRPAPKKDVAQCRVDEEAAAKAYYQAVSTVNERGELAQRRDRLKEQMKGDAELPSREKVEKSRAARVSMQTQIEAEVRSLEVSLQQKRNELREVQGAIGKHDEALLQIESAEARGAELARIERELAEGSPVVDVESLLDAKEEAKALREAREQQDAYDAAASKYTKAKAAAATLGELVKLFRDTIPQQLLAQAELPIEDLTVTQEQILVRGVPLHQLGTAEQIRVGVVVAKAINPRAGFITVDRAESLGREGRRALAETAKEMGLQIIMTCVDPDAQPSDGVTVMRAGAAVASKN